MNRLSVKLTAAMLLLLTLAGCGINNIPTYDEQVKVLAKQADNYYYILTLWAAVIALLTPFILHLTPLWLSGYDMLIIQWIVFILLAVLLRIPPLMMRLVPKRVRHWRAANLARRQFLENNLHHTKGETGVLIFVSEAEHYVEIIADRGISEHVADEAWQGIVDGFIARVKGGEVKEGFIECVNRCGELLKEHVPATEEKDELGNGLVVLG